VLALWFPLDDGSLVLDAWSPPDGLGFDALILSTLLVFLASSGILLVVAVAYDRLAG